MIVTSMLYNVNALADANEILMFQCKLHTCYFRFVFFPIYSQLNERNFDRVNS